MKKRIAAIILALMIIISVPVISFAEFGDFGGDSDYGYDSGGGYDYGGGYNYDDDDDNYYYVDNNRERETTTTSYYSYIGSTSNDDNFGGYYNYKSEKINVTKLFNKDTEEADYSTVLGAIIAGFIFIIVVIFKRSKAKPVTPVRRAPVAPGAALTDRSTLNNIAGYRDIDPQFSESALKEKLSNVYVQMQNCWQKKNIETLRPYFTDSLYAQFDTQLDAYRRKHETNYVERIAVLGIEFTGWRKVGENDQIIAVVRTRIVDYVLSDDTGKLVRGNDKLEKFMTYEWTLSRKSGVKTAADTGTRVVSCPHCGAPVDINKSAKCEYCGSIITVDSTDWVISEIKGISQRTGS